MSISERLPGLLLHVFRHNRHNAIGVPSDLGWGAKFGYAGQIPGVHFCFFTVSTIWQARKCIYLCYYKEYLCNNYKENP
jgi:hypothetical protein